MPRPVWSFSPTDADNEAVMAEMDRLKRTLPAHVDVNRSMAFRSLIARASAVQVRTAKRAAPRKQRVTVSVHPHGEKAHKRARRSGSGFAAIEACSNASSDLETSDIRQAMLGLGAEIPRELQSGDDSTE